MEHEVLRPVQLDGAMRARGDRVDTRAWPPHRVAVLVARRYLRPLAVAEVLEAAAPMTAAAGRGAKR